MGKVKSKQPCNYRPISERVCSRLSEHKVVLGEVWRLKIFLPLEEEPTSEEGVNKLNPGLVPNAIRLNNWRLIGRGHVH